MHTHKAENGTVFNFNLDFSGEVHIKHQGQEIQIPAEDLLEFIGYEYVGMKRIGWIEQAHWRELLR